MGQSCCDCSMWIFPQIFTIILWCRYSYHSFPRHRKMLNDLSSVTQLVNDGSRVSVCVYDSEPLPKTGKQGVRVNRKAEMVDQIKKQNHERKTGQSVSQLGKMEICWWQAWLWSVWTDLWAEWSHFLSRGNFLASGGILETWWSHLNALAPFLSSLDDDWATSCTFPVLGQNLLSHPSCSLEQSCIPEPHLICTFFFKHTLSSLFHKPSMQSSICSFTQARTLKRCASRVMNKVRDQFLPSHTIPGSVPSIMRNINLSYIFENNAKTWLNYVTKHAVSLADVLPLPPPPPIAILFWWRNQGIDLHSCSCSSFLRWVAL